MDVGLIINITLSILSFILAAISIVIVVLTLKQNNKMLEESVRPVICIYSEYLLVGDGFLYLVIKNFGHSAATITRFDTDIDLTGCYIINSKKDFLKEVEGSLLAPGQSRVCLLDYEKVNKMIRFSINYNNGIKKYKETFYFNPATASNLPTNRAGGKDYNKHVEHVSETLQEMLKKNL